MRWGGRGEKEIYRRANRRREYIPRAGGMPALEFGLVPPNGKFILLLLFGLALNNIHKAVERSAVIVHPARVVRLRVCNVEALVEEVVDETMEALE